MLRGKEIILGVTGGIACYKAVELLRRLTKDGANVSVVMTEHAREFVGPLTFQTLSKNPVITEMFPQVATPEMKHITLAERADLLLVVPATANIMGKFASGIADDFLSTFFLAVRCPIMVAPAMDWFMYENAVVQRNIERLRGFGVEIIEPEIGELASGMIGRGRLADVETIVDAVVEKLAPKKDLAGKIVLVSAGPTQEPIDAIRMITNPSSGKMGYAVAQVARWRGADVILVSGPTTLPKPRGVNVISIRTAVQMREAVMSHVDKADLVIKTAAVADFRPKEYFPGKIKKTEADLVVELERNPDILAEVGARKGNKILVGFAAETQDLLENAKKKMAEKNLDLVVANDISVPGIGFASDDNQVKLLYKDGTVEDLPKMSKIEVAEAILDRVVERYLNIRD